MILPTLKITIAFRLMRYCWRRKLYFRIGAIRGRQLANNTEIFYVPWFIYCINKGGLTFVHHTVSTQDVFGAFWPVGWQFDSISTVRNNIDEQRFMWSLNLSKRTLLNGKHFSQVFVFKNQKILLWNLIPS